MYNILEALQWCDVANILRIQLERQDIKYIFRRCVNMPFITGVNKASARQGWQTHCDHAPWAHQPGSGDQQRCGGFRTPIILDQVENGVAIRMAVLYLLAGKKITNC